MLRESENPSLEGWGGGPFHDSLRSSGSSPEAQSLGLPSGKDRPGLTPTRPVQKAGQAEGSAFIGEEPQQDQAWDGRVMTFVASTNQVDRNGNILDIDGWELDHYRANPVVLFNHNWDLPPVGKTLQMGILPGIPGREGPVGERRLMVTIQFAPTPLGRELAILNANRYMGAASVGARMLEWEIRRHPERGYPIGLHSHRHELLEVSVVPVPANPDTLQAGIELGLPTQAYADLGPDYRWNAHFLPAHLICPESSRRVGLQPWPGTVPAARLLRAINFGLRGD